MKVIVDSGSTKATWVFLEDEGVRKTLTTSGLNPYFHTTSSVEALIRADIAPHVMDYNIREIHFYGAGCSTINNDRMISEAIRIFYPEAEINVYHDILGAARALFGHGSGIACILGTGCNSCYFDGIRTYSPIDSLGYLFGDEGAGSYLGKLFIGAYLRKELPADLRVAFDSHYGFTLEDMLNSLYNKPYPNRFLASFSLFLAPNRHHPYIQDLLRRSFRDFLDAHIRKYDNYRSADIGFIGSIAHIYRDDLAAVVEPEGLRIARILSSPAEGLIEYHR